jgi:nitroimidazol reductase NimA-like FMN-containing flavoprotein (pyridoxamine 5'-phosphate oxidase superfamily)
MTSKLPQETRQALKDIQAIFKSQRFGVLSTHSDGQPYASLVAFSATDDLQRILFCTPRATRKYTNLCCDGRVAMLVHNSQNAAIDCDQASAVTATGTAVEVTGDQRSKEAVAFLSKHPELTDFVNDTNTAILSMIVSDYHLVQRFQEVVRIPMETEAIARNATSNCNRSSHER